MIPLFYGSKCNNLGIFLTQINFFTKSRLKKIQYQQPVLGARREICCEIIEKPARPKTFFSHFFNIQPKLFKLGYQLSNDTKNI